MFEPLYCKQYNVMYLCLQVYRNVFEIKFKGWLHTTSFLQGLSKLKISVEYENDDKLIDPTSVLANHLDVMRM